MRAATEPPNCECAGALYSRSLSPGWRPRSGPPRPVHDPFAREHRVMPRKNTQHPGARRLLIFPEAQLAFSVPRPRRRCRERGGVRRWLRSRDTSAEDKSATALAWKSLCRSIETAETACSAIHSATLMASILRLRAGAGDRHIDHVDQHPDVVHGLDHRGAPRAAIDARYLVTACLPSGSR